MRESKLTEMLKGISPDEFKKFGEFLNSPFHNKSKKILQLYNLVAENFEEFDANKVTKEEISKNLFPEDINNDQNARTLISNFTTLLEEFLTLILESENQNIPKKINLLKSLRDRNILKTFDMTSKEIIEHSQKEFNRNSEYYYDDLTFKEIILNYHGEDLDLDLDKSYFDMSKTADYLYFVSKLKIVNTVLSRRVLSGKNILSDYWGVAHILEYLEENIDEIQKSHPIIYSEYKILMMTLKPEDLKHYHDLEKHVFANVEKLNDEELAQVYHSLSNFCVNKIAIGEERYKQNLLKIHNAFEKAGFYKKNKNIHYSDFMSIIICGLNSEEIKWVKYFFDSYKSNIAHEFKRDTINLAYALITFEEKKYKESIEALNKITYKYSYFYLKSKETLIRAYYEMGDDESMVSAIDATKHYLKRHKNILSIHYERFMMFLNFATRLMRIDKKDKAEQKLLIKELDEHRSTISREWLIEKIIELK
ncbi:MAG TPA: hypothetical protein VGK25_10120 [Ignavibacteria bacterium]|jgi:hypothetical protein